MSGAMNIGSTGVKSATVPSAGEFFSTSVARRVPAPERLSTSSVRPPMASFIFSASSRPM